MNNYNQQSNNQKELEKVYNFMNAIEGYSSTLDTEVIDEYFNLVVPNLSETSSKN